jgi:dGTPase
MAGLRSADDARQQKEKLVYNSADVQRQKRELLSFLRERFYHNPVVAEVNTRAVSCLQQLFALYLKHPHLLANSFQIRIKKDGVARATCDYLACMTDRFALQEYGKLIGEAPIIESVGVRQESLF